MTLLGRPDPFSSRNGGCPSRINATAVTAGGRQRLAPGEHRPAHRVQSQPNSAATSATGRASRPTAIVAQRPARAVNADRAGAISSATSANETTAQFVVGQRQRRLCHTNRTGCPKAGVVIAAVVLLRALAGILLELRLRADSTGT